MPTPKQVELYIDLCEQLGQDADVEEFERMNYKEVKEAIDELIEMRREQKDKFEGKDDGRYWY